jgi:hypothetical protein
VARRAWGIQWFKFLVLSWERMLAEALCLIIIGVSLWGDGSLIIRFKGNETKEERKKKETLDYLSQFIIINWKLEQGNCSYHTAHSIN